MPAMAATLSVLPYRGVGSAGISVTPASLPGVGGRWLPITVPQQETHTHLGGVGGGGDLFYFILRGC